MFDVISIDDSMSTEEADRDGNEHLEGSYDSLQKAIEETDKVAKESGKSVYVYDDTGTRCFAASAE